MATRTSVGSGLWSAAGTWDTGVPVNTDTVIIASGHDVEFDVDQSGFAAGITLTITGTLHASTTAGAYTLKLQANMTGAGTLRAGTSGTPYPTNCTFTINRNGFEITATNMTLDLNCSEPTNKYIRLSAQEAAGQTVWSVDTDVTADAAWVSGAIVRICDVNNTNDNEERTLSATSSTTVTVTSGLTAQKESGAYIVLIDRNVKIIHTSASGNGVNGGSGGTISAEVRNAVSGIVSRSLATIGGTISGCTQALNSTLGCTVNAQIAGNSSGAISGSGNVYSSSCAMVGNTNGLNVETGAIIAGRIAGTTNAMNTCNSCQILPTALITESNTGINRGGSNIVNGATITCATDLLDVINMQLYNALLSGTTEFSGYNGARMSINAFSESVDHDQVANAYRAWTKGGIVDSDIGTVYTGRTRSYKHACTTASFYTFQNRTFTVQPGGGLVVQCYVRKSATMSYLPRVWILTPGQEPFISGSPNAEDIMTDSVDTWEELNLVYANGGTSPIDVVVRTVAKNASGNVFFDPIVTVLAPATYDVYNTLTTLMTTIERKVDDNQALIIAS